MNTIELKNILIHRISEIEDVSFLNAIKTILDSKTNKEVIKLSSEQRNEIIASKKEIERDLFIDNNDLDAEIKEWLSAK